MNAMLKINRWECIAALLSGLAVFLPVAQGELPSPENTSLPPDQLAYYSDTFDSFREDLWEKAGHVFSKEQLGNFKQIRMDFKDGKLVMETETGCFSKGGLVSKYALRGDFDIRLECQTSFKRTIGRMDHLLGLVLLDEATETESVSTMAVQVIKRGKWDTPRVVTGFRKEGEHQVVTRHDVPHEFAGTLRMERKGDTVYGMYRLKGKDAWNSVGEVSFGSGDMYVVIALQNFISKRTSIEAPNSIKATFDSFRIRSAQGIVESEI